MGGDLLSASTLIGFLLTMVRVAGVFVFVPIPGLKSAVDPARVLLMLGVTIALYPVWPHPAGDVSAGLFVLWIMSEAALGIGIGLAVGFAIEAFHMVGAQVIGLAGRLLFCLDGRPVHAGRLHGPCVSGPDRGRPAVLRYGLDRVKCSGYSPGASWHFRPVRLSCRVVLRNRF